MDVLYKGDKVGRKRVDFVVGSGLESVLLEIKAKLSLEDVDFVQALSYLKASGYKVGLLINFGASAWRSRDWQTRRLSAFIRSVRQWFKSSTPQTV